jgi:hypothetical protein
LVAKIASEVSVIGIVDASVEATVANSRLSQVVSPKRLNDFHF